MLLVEDSDRFDVDCRLWRISGGVEVEGTPRVLPVELSDDRRR